MLTLAAVAGGLTVDVVTAPPASAHATLVATMPADGARLDAAPAEVELEFTEPVSVGAGYVRVLGPDGERVDTGSPVEDGVTVVAPLRAGLPDASYTVSYRVVSEDAHPISGAYAFVVGDGELAPVLSAAGADNVDGTVGVALPVARWLGFAGMALTIGIPVFLFLCWPAGWGDRTMRRLTSAGLVAIVAAAVLTFLLQGPYVGGVGLEAVFDPSLLSATAGSSFGVIMLLRIVCGLALAAVLTVVWRREAQPTVPLAIVGAALFLGLAVTVAAVGHAAAGSLPGLAVSITSVHVLAMAVWLGGLTALLVVVVRSRVPAAQLTTALLRYSQLAFGSVGTLVVTGVLQSVREVGSPTALAGTTYGQLLLAKVLVVIVLLAVAGVSRVWVQQQLGGPRPRPGRRTVTAHAFAAGEAETAAEQHVQDRTDTPADAGSPDLRPLRRSVLIEVAIGAVILALSAVLVGTPPARSTIAEPVDVTLPLQGSADAEASGAVQLTVDPASTGPNTLHIYAFDGSGQLIQPDGIEVTLSEKAREIGPLEVDLLPGGPGHFIGDGMSIPAAGTWTLTVTVRVDEFTATTASVDFPVR
ncbi:copper resistance protein CopC [Blastococcus sp. KM273128]|uniref:copper resistance CopC/CopD family protein n=1 Tax=Blastococcus sp. KM273128 TaxID=2570314 RepID=UPI001F031641|nr:copper resistance protein CopC [Blastococcus sp. KM273128]